MEILNEKELRETAVESRKILMEFIRGKRAGTDQVKLASLAITQCIKCMATQGAIRASKYAALRDQVGNKELERVIAGHLPEYSIKDEIEHKK